MSLECLQFFCVNIMLFWHFEKKNNAIPTYMLKSTFLGLLSECKHEEWNENVRMQSTQKIYWNGLRKCYLVHHSIFFSSEYVRISFRTFSLTWAPCSLAELFKIWDVCLWKSQSFQWNRARKYLGVLHIVEAIRLFFNKRCKSNCFRQNVCLYWRYVIWSCKIAKISAWNSCYHNI